MASCAALAVVLITIPSLSTIGAEPPANAAVVVMPADATPVKVTASSEESGNGNLAWRAVDNDDATRWCAAGGQLPQWLRLEFDKPYPLTGIKIVWEQNGTAYRHSVETSTDGTTWTVAFDATSAAVPGPADHAFARVTAKFLRITCVGSTGGWASIREVAIRGEGIQKLHPELDPEQKAAHARTAGDPYAKQGNAPPRAVPPTPERERTILAEVKVPEGFEATLFAAPPMVNYPVFVAAALDGTLYVSSDGNGSLGRDPARGRIIRLRDTDADGRADETRVFCEVDAPRGLVWDHDRLYVMHPPHLSVYIDKDADGVADEKQVLVKDLAFGYDKRPADHTTNGLSLGIDGWLYVAVGDFGFMNATGTDGRRLTLRGGGVVRVRPDGTGLELYSSGTRNILEVAISPQMELFARDNTNDGGGWDVRFHHFTGLDDHGYPRLYKNFGDECVQPLADYGGGSGCGATYIAEPGFGEWNDAPFTADWGTGGLYRHSVQPKGATFEEVAPPRPFIQMPRPTDADVDGMSRVYCASWKGATFNWAGPDVGYIVCVKPKGYTPEPLPDFTHASAAELAGLLSADSPAGQRRRLAASRELSRRDKGQDPSWLHRVAESRPEGRTLIDRFKAIVAAGDPAAADELIAHVGSADPVVSHTAIRGLAALGTSAAALAALDASPASRGPLLRSLAMMHSSDVVSGLIRRLDVATDAGLRKDLLTALCRLHFREGEWRGDSWGTRPDTRGPYYQPEPWSETPRIAAALDSTLQRATPDETAFLAREMHRHRIPADGAIDRIIVAATRDPRVVPDAVAQLAEANDIPSAAVPVLVVAIRSAASSPLTILQAITALAKVGSAEALTASLDGLVHLEEIVAEHAAAEVAVGKAADPKTLQEHQVLLREARRSLETASTVLVAAPGLDQHEELLAATAASTLPAAAWADAAILHLSSRKNGSPEAREHATKDLDAGWASSPRRRIQILRAAAAIKHTGSVERILAALDDGDEAVRQVAAETAKALKITRENDTTPRLASLAPEAALAAVLGTKGDAATGERLFTRATCVACHTIRQDQPQKGPYLGNIARTYKRPELAQAILYPDKTIAQGFVSEVFVLDDGTQQTGYVALEAADVVRIRNAAGQEIVLPASRIEERHRLPTSMMPTGLMANCTVREFASLLDYLESLAETQ
jgi:putative membrane-bound dehydrogenase-like protein